jgi:hypothetical protein
MNLAYNWHFHFSEGHYPTFSNSVLADLVTSCSQLDNPYRAADIQYNNLLYPSKLHSLNIEQAFGDVLMFWIVKLRNRKPYHVEYPPPDPIVPNKRCSPASKQDALSYGVLRVYPKDEERFVPIEYQHGIPFDVQRDNLFFQAFAAWWHDPFNNVSTKVGHECRVCDKYEEMLVPRVLRFHDPYCSFASQVIWPVDQAFFLSMIDTGVPFTPLVHFLPSRNDRNQETLQFL